MRVVCNRVVCKIVTGALIFLSKGLLTHSQLAMSLVAQSSDFERPQQIKYFSLRHLAPEAMDNSDRELLRVRRKELMSEAQFYGYDLTAGNWTYDQTICPALPDTVLLHYLEKFPDASESLFTALIPRREGRVRIVPVLYRNATPYIPAVKNPRNFELFNSIVPAAIAKKDSNTEGRWLSLGVCYAEVVGGRPNVPDEPSLDAATIKAPVATYRFDAGTSQRQIQFSDRGDAKVYTIWNISLNESGRVIGATNEDYATYVAHIVQPPQPDGTTRPAPPARVVTPPASQPSVKLAPDSPPPGL
jgi:hypothetical protein